MHHRRISIARPQSHTSLPSTAPNPEPPQPPRHRYENSGCAQQQVSHWSIRPKRSAPVSSRRTGSASSHAVEDPAPYLIQGRAAAEQDIRLRPPPIRRLRPHTKTPRHSHEGGNPRPRLHGKSAIAETHPRYCYEHGGAHTATKRSLDPFVLSGVGWRAGSAPSHAVKEPAPYLIRGRAVASKTSA